MMNHSEIKYMSDLIRNAIKSRDWDKILELEEFLDEFLDESNDDD